MYAFHTHRHLAMFGIRMGMHFSLQTHTENAILACRNVKKGWFLRCQIKLLYVNHEELLVKLSQINFRKHRSVPLIMGSL